MINHSFSSGVATLTAVLMLSASLQRIWLVHFQHELIMLFITCFFGANEVRGATQKLIIIFYYAPHEESGVDIAVGVSKVMTGSCSVKIELFEAPLHY